MPFHTYIIFSPSLNKYYIGETENVETRLAQHNTSYFKGSFTTQVSDWQLFFSVEFNERAKARKFEAFIKKMKSRKFVESIKSDEIKRKDLIQKFS